MFWFVFEELELCVCECAVVLHARHTPRNAFFMRRCYGNNKKGKRILTKFNFDKKGSLESLRAVARHREKRRAENEGR